MGSILAGGLSDKFGRKPTILAFTAVLAAGGFLSALAPSLPVLIVIRTVAGIGLGGTLPTTSNCRLYPRLQRSNFNSKDQPVKYYFV